MKVNLQDVINAVDYVSDSMPSFYVVPEEKVITVDAVQVKNLPYEENELIRLPDRHDVDDYGNMQRFIKHVQDETAQEWLSNAIVGRGAFRMFRAALERFHLLNDWYEYRDRCHRVLAMDWCEENGIEYEGPRYIFEEEDDDYGDDYDEDVYEEETPVIRQAAPVKTETAPQFRLVEIGRKNVSQLIFLGSDYRDEMLQKRGKEPLKDPDEAGRQLEQMIADGERITAVSDHGRYLGYCAVRPEGERALMHEIFVRRDMRKKGIGTMLVSAACSDADDNHQRLIFRVKPDQNEMLSLLAEKGFITLSAMEITHENEAETENRVSLGSTGFRY